MRGFCRTLPAIAVALGGAACQAAATRPANPFLEDTRQLTFAGRRAGEGYFGPRDRRLVFQSERAPGNPFFQIYSFRLATGAVERISPGPGKTTCAWIHPDGERVLFASTHEDPAAERKEQRERERRKSPHHREYSWDFDPRFEIYQRRGPDGRIERLTNAAGYDAEGSYSPDGESILFASNRHAYGAGAPPEAAARREKHPELFMELYRKDLDTGEVTRLTHTRGYDGGPFFSADGARICWRRFSESGETAEIWTMRADGTAKRRLTDLGAISWAPFFHPSGDYLIFSSNPEGFGNFELYLIDAAGEHEPVRVTRTEGFDGLPAFSHDGDRLSWTSDRGAGEHGQIFLARWDDAAAREALDLPPRETATTRRAARERPKLSAPALERRVETLAGDAFGGRAPGTAGGRRATAYVAEHFERAGLRPAGSDGFFEPFSFPRGVELAEGNRLRLERAGKKAPRAPKPGAAWRPLAFSATGSFDAGEIVFAGYGIDAGKTDKQPAYDSYADVEAEGRWALVWRGLPPVSGERRHFLAPHASLRRKAYAARKNGARGLLVAPREPRDALPPIADDGAAGSSGLPAVLLRHALAERLIAASGRAVPEPEAGEAVTGFALAGWEASARIRLSQQTGTARNVVARLPGRDDDAEPVVLGAHVDHLGRGEGGASLADDGAGRVHPGADDNASGVAALMAVARRLADRGPFRRPILFAAFDAEELGLLGSSHFVERRSEEGADAPFAAHVNMDMIGSLHERLLVQGTASSPAWPRAIERANAPVALPLRPRADPYVPSDAMSFYTRGVPAIHLFTGAHDRYHTPRDTPETLNYAGLARIGALAARLVGGLAERAEPPDYEAVEREATGDRDFHLTATLGTIPDYSGGGRETEGLPLSGVAPEGPAAKAGLRGGDVVVELAGESIGDIYDYTYAIEGLAPGEGVTIVVERDGERLEREIVPERRE